MRAMLSLLPLFAGNETNLKASIQHSVLCITRRAAEMDIFGLKLLLLNKDYRNRCHHFFIASSRTLYTHKSIFRWPTVHSALGSAERSVHSLHHVCKSQRERVWIFFKLKNRVYMFISIHLYSTICICSMAMDHHYFQQPINHTKCACVFAFFLRLFSLDVFYL